MISIIIPVHNGEKYVKKCIESVLNNTYKDLEVIIVENASSDRTLDICNEYSKCDSRIKVISTKEKGLSHARNVGLKYACGEYIAFVDADDYVSPYLYEKMITCMEKNNADLVFCDYMIGENKEYKFDINETVKERSFTVDEYLHNVYLKAAQQYTVVWNKLFKRQLMKGIKFDEEIKYFEDRLFVIQYVSSVFQIYFIDFPLYYYYRGNESSICLSANMYDRMYQLYSLQKEILFFEKNYSERIKWREFANACLLQNADYRMKRAKEEKLYDLQRETEIIKKSALYRLKKSKYLSRYDKIRLLLEHYCPKLFQFVCRVINKVK